MSAAIETAQSNPTPQAGRRRIALVSPHHWAHSMGGAELQLRFLLEKLVSLDCYEIAYLARGTNPKFSSDGYQIVSLARGRRGGSWLRDAAPLVRSLAEFRPDVIYQRSGGVYTGAAAWYARRAGIPLVWHIAHDTDVIPHSLAQGSLLRPDRWLEKRMLGLAIRAADRIIAQSAQQAKLLERHYRREAAAIVGNFHPSPPVKPKPPGPVVALWAANLKPVKQPEVMLRLARRLFATGIRLQVAGRVRAGQYERLVDELRRLPNVEYLGEVAPERVNTLLDEAHLFINTSVMEGFPNTFVQAWLREVPVISLNVDPDGALSERGLGVHAGSEEHLAKCVRQLAEDAERRADMGRAARQYALKTHSLANIDDVIALLEQSP